MRTDDSLPSACGCHQCGGSDARNRALLARRVVRYAPFIAARRHTSARELANRCEPLTLYSRLILAAASREKGQR